MQYATVHDLYAHVAQLKKVPNLKPWPYISHSAVTASLEHSCTEAQDQTVLQSFYSEITENIHPQNVSTYDLCLWAC